MDTTDTITTEKLTDRIYQCDRPHPRNNATLTILRNGQFDALGCAECVVLVPGYYGDHKPTDILDMWEVRYGADGIGLTHCHVYGTDMDQARAHARVALAIAGFDLNAEKGLFTVHQLRAAEVARTVAFRPAPDFDSAHMVVLADDSERADRLRRHLTYPH